MKILFQLTFTSTLAKESANDISSSLNSRQCITRYSIAITGNAPDQSLLDSNDPESKENIQKLLTSQDFYERFARFINHEFSDERGDSSEEDASYHMAKHVLENNLKWKDMFVGKLNVVEQNGRVRVRNDPNGLGYTRSDAWAQRYAGNEGNGVRINTAYRVMQNTFGLELVAADLPADADTTVEGRNTQQPCKSCHFDQVTALDPVATAFPNVVRNNQGGFIRFAEANKTPQQALGGESFTNDADLMNVLTSSLDYEYHSCELAYKFVTGRDENTCGKPVMDKCLTAFKETGYIQDAIASIITSEEICR